MYVPITSLSLPKPDGSLRPPALAYCLRCAQVAEAVLGKAAPGGETRLDEEAEGAAGELELAVEEVFVLGGREHPVCSCAYALI